MLVTTDHVSAPWEVIAAESKHYARVEILETVTTRIEDALSAVGQVPIEIQAEL